VDAINATVNVGYSEECAGSSYTKSYTGQILVRNRGSKFLAGGDSGSVMFEDVAVNPRAVGLLYAGDSTLAVANPIDEVMAALNVNMVGVATSASGAATDGDAAVAAAMQAQERHANLLESVPGFVGHGIGIGSGGAPVIKVFVEDPSPAVRATLPHQLDGYAVIMERSGRLMAF
jgi:hypothetical protein